MADRSTFLVVPAAKRDDANAVFAAMERGPNTFSVKASATGNDPATHYFGHDGSMGDALATTCGRMPDDSGAVPEIEGTWLEAFPGEANEAAAEAKAKAACAAMQISVATNISGAEHRDGILRGLSLQEIELEI